VTDGQNGGTDGRTDRTGFINSAILQSRLFGELDLDADCYADMFEAEVKRVLDIHAPLRTGRRCCGQHDSRHLSDEARQSKQLRKQLERRYLVQASSQTNWPINQLVRLHVKASPSHDPITSRHNSTRHPVTSVLLGERHSGCCITDSRSCQLVLTFCQFFVDKLRRIRDNISATLQSSGRCTFAVRQHLGPELSSFEPVTVKEVRKLLSTMSSKSSPLDVLPCQLLKSCAHDFVPAIARLANLSLQTGKFPARYKTAQMLPLLNKARLDSSLPANYRPIDRVQGPRETGVDTPAPSSARLCQLQSVPVRLQEGALHGDGTIY